MNDYERGWSAGLYLGHGLYGSFDGRQIILRAPRVGGEHWVALGPATWQSLNDWISRHADLKGHMEGKMEAGT